MGQRVGVGLERSKQRKADQTVCMLSTVYELARKICTDSHKSRFQSATVAKVQPGNSKMRRLEFMPRNVK
jgi:hypothetical protein